MQFLRYSLRVGEEKLINNKIVSRLQTPPRIIVTVLRESVLRGARHLDRFHATRREPRNGTRPRISPFTRNFIAGHKNLRKNRRPGRRITLDQEEVARSFGRCVLPPCARACKEETKKSGETTTPRKAEEDAREARRRHGRMAGFLRDGGKRGAVVVSV